MLFDKPHEEIGKLWANTDLARRRGDILIEETARVVGSSYDDLTAEERAEIKAMLREMQEELKGGDAID